jgi:hypothetical protein
MRMCIGDQAHSTWAMQRADLGIEDGASPSASVPNVIDLFAGR